jgi:hypothetical protein
MIRFYRSQYPQENVVIEAAYEGCPRDKTITSLDDYQPSDVAVVMGVYKKRVPASYPRGEIIRQQNLRGLKCLILETGYINRGSGEDNHYALGWNGLNGRADFRNKDMPSDRAEKLRVGLQPWKDTGDYILLCGQVPWDASVDFTDHVTWLNHASEIIHKGSLKPILFRPHPLARIPPLDGCGYSTRPLEEDLEGAAACVNYNSNTGVDAILAGVPTHTFDIGSMIYSVSSHDWEIGKPFKPDRQQWLNDICYAQWTPQELRSGEAWKHILKNRSTAE